MITLVAIISFLFCFVGAQLDPHRVNVAVYYESLCPDARRFFTKQLYPSLETNLSMFVDLTLIPYGKSKTTIESPNQYQFTCHHGPAECRGNRIHVCAIRHIENGRNTEGLGYNKDTAAFINCLMAVQPNGERTEFPTRECATIYEINNVGDIENCTNNSEGYKLLFETGVVTGALQSPLESVPTIVFNNAFKREDSHLAETNFVKALCQYIEGDKPAECGHENSGIRFTSSFFALLGVGFFYLI